MLFFKLIGCILQILDFGEIAFGDGNQGYCSYIRSFLWDALCSDGCRST
jgi:hypothetical protein